MVHLAKEEIELIKLALAGLFGSILFVFWRHQGSPWRAVFILVIGTIIAPMFAHDVSALISWAAGHFLGMTYTPNPYQVGAFLGLSAIPITQKVLGFVEGFDLDVLKRVKK